MMKRLILAAALLWPIALGGQPAAAAGAAAAVNLAAVPISRTDLPWWRERFDRSLERVRQGHVSLVWLGDSITQNWEMTGPLPWGAYAPVWNRFYGDRDAVNMGFRGDTTANVIWRLDHGEVDGIAPKALVLLIGANNFGRVHWDAAKTLQGIDTVVGILRRKLPKTQILLIGVLPSERSPWITANTAILNEELAEAYRSRPYVTFENVGYLFYKNGRLNRALYLDPHEAVLAATTPGATTATVPSVALHPDAQGMELIAMAIEPLLHRLMNDRDHLRAPAG
jgi:lysophospholipase L1-like esterase